MDQSNNASGSGSGSGAKQPVFDRAYRINELNKIEQNIAKLLRTAGEAMQALTPQQQDQSAETGASIEERKATFSKATSEYFAALSYVDIHLRREIYALEEALIIPVDVIKEPLGQAATLEDVRKVLGNLDVGWLNSRNDKVGMDMQAELWAQAKEILDGVNLDELFRNSEEVKSEPLEESKE